MAGEPMDLDPPSSLSLSSLSSPSLPLPTLSSPSSSSPLSSISSNFSKNGTHLFNATVDCSPAIIQIFLSLIGSEEVIDWRKSNQQRTEVSLVCKMWNHILRSQVLHLSVSPVNLEYFLSSLNSFPNLLALNVYGAIGDLGAQLFSSVKQPISLKTLDLSVNSIGELGAEKIALSLSENYTLTKLDIGDNEIHDNGAIAIFNAITGKNLEWLSVQDCGLDYDSLEYFGNIVLPNTKLRSLNWSYNPISYFGAVPLATGLKSNTTIRKLRLQQCDLAGYSALAFSEVMKVNNTITSLNVNGNEFSDTGAVRLTEALKLNTFNNLTKLKITDNGISEGISSFGSLLATTKTLTYLDLSMNRFGSQPQMAEFLTGLGSNTTLKTLILAGTDIHDDFGPAIGKALSSNRSITHIDLSTNNLEFQINELVVALRSNGNLSNVNLSKNLFREKEVLELILALENNTTLTYLNVSRCKLTGTTPAIRAVCKKVILNVRKETDAPHKVRVLV